MTCSPLALLLLVVDREAIVRERDKKIWPPYRYTVKMEATCSSETSIDLRPTRLHYVAENMSLDGRCAQNTAILTITRHHQDNYWFEIGFKFRPSDPLYRPRSSLFCTARPGNFLDSTYSCHYNFLAH
jgi:hypothetical protein